MSAALTTTEQAGTLYYSTGWRVEPESMRGHFYLDGHKVIARKYRGRNSYYLTAARSVIMFESTTKEGNS